MNLSPIQSKVTERQAEVQEGTQLVYSDICNYETFTVKSIFDGGFTAVDEETGIVSSYDFESLQYGWRFQKPEIIPVG